MKVVFLGPSLPPGVSLEGLRVLPPARRGDVRAAIDAGATAVGLVDGEVYQSLAPPPAELRAACARVPVYGAASLGALRAVEVPGMIGIGEVWRRFHDGELTDDDELVGTWDADTGRTVAWPLILAREALPGEAALRRMKALPFHERTAPALARIVAAHGGDASAFLERLRRQPNLKQRDAALLVATMRG